VAFTVEDDFSLLIEGDFLGSDEELTSTNVDLLGVKLNWTGSIIEGKSSINGEQVEDRGVFVEDHVHARKNFDIFASHWLNAR
jgi:hypothetical protein